MNRIAIASDHAGFELKSSIIKHYSNWSFLDLGVNSASVSVDYPDYAYKVVDCIMQHEVSTGILICSSGIGMSIAANRNSSIRAAVCHNVFTAERAKSHNDANVLVLGASIVTQDLAFQIVEKFFNTQFEGGRHSIRIAKLS